MSMSKKQIKMVQKMIDKSVSKSIDKLSEAIIKLQPKTEQDMEDWMSDATAHIKEDDYPDTTRGDNKMNYDMGVELGFGPDD